MTIATIITITTPLLAFMAGVFFSKWMDDRRRARTQGWGRSGWYRENPR